MVKKSATTTKKKTASSAKSKPAKTSSKAKASTVKKPSPKKTQQVEEQFQPMLMTVAVCTAAVVILFLVSLIGVL